MARVTVEDCIVNVPDRFELVSLAAQRAKQIASGAALTIDRDNDKDSVVSLREIAGQTVDLDELREEMIVQKQRYQPRDKHAEEEVIEESSPAQLDKQQVEADVGGAYEEDTAHAPGREIEEESDAANLSFSDENIEAED